VRALLDEQLSPEIAAELRTRGHDVIAVGERPDLIGLSDRDIIVIAHSESRAVITNNVKDFRPLAADRLARGEQHGGLILLPSARARTRAQTAHLADAVAAVLTANPGGLESSERWVGPVDRH
jgi:predicted nuclease of predicted toxin-antitoxin system